MRNNLSRFDAAEYLDGPEARAEYLRAAMETEDMAFILDAIGVLARAKGMSQVAEEAEVGRASLYNSARRQQPRIRNDHEGTARAWGADLGRARQTEF